MLGLTTDGHDRVKCSKWPKMSRIIYDEQTHLHLSLETRLSLQLLTFYKQGNKVSAELLPQNEKIQGATMSQQSTLLP